MSRATSAASCRPRISLDAGTHVDSPHVEACRSTGTSPGRSGTSRVSVPGKYTDRIEAEIGWEVHGPADAPPIVVLGGISAGSHLIPTQLDPTPGWWSGVVGRGAALDPRRHRLIGVDFLGRAEALSPLAQPVCTTDQARAIAAVLDHIGVTEVTLVGSSYGGMVALAFASLYPERTGRVVALCAAHRSHPMATALRSIQRRLARLSEGESDGLALARALAMTTYRSAEEFEGRFRATPSVEGGRARFEVESYLEARGRDFSRRFSAEGFIRLSESIDLHAVAPETVTVPTTLVSFDTDTLVPPMLVEELAVRSPGVVRHRRVRSLFGHDAFLKEIAVVSAVLTEALAGLEVAR